MNIAQELRKLADQVEREAKPEDRWTATFRRGELTCIDFDGKYAGLITVDEVINVKAS